MWVVNFECEPIDTDDVTIRHCRFVVKHAVPNVLLHVGRRRDGQIRAKSGSVEKALFPQFVSALKNVGKPSGLSLRVRNAQIGEPFKDATKDVVEHRAHRILEGQYRRDDEWCIGSSRRHL